MRWSLTKALLGDFFGKPTNQGSFVGFGQRMILALTVTIYAWCHTESRTTVDHDE
jgi:hypothetical protein